MKEYIERASRETKYDAIKFIAFSFFILLYPIFKERNLVAYAICVLIFIIVLFFINMFKEKKK